MKYKTLRTCAFVLATSLCTLSPVHAGLFENDQDYEWQQYLQELHGFADQTIYITARRQYYFYDVTDPSLYQVNMFVDMREMWR